MTWWQAYEREYEGRAVVETMEHTQKAIKARFWHRDSPYVIEWAGKRVKSLKRGIID